MAEAFLVVGLGNPGIEYDDTRHNVGFMVVDELSVRHNALWKPERGEYLHAAARLFENSLVLLKPMTYMNGSGRAVIEGLRRFDIPVENLIVIVDDVALPLGTIRVRARGTDGGHNGLRSVIDHLETYEFARIRCGIRQETMPADLAEFVLSPFEVSEREGVREMILRAANAAECIVRFGVAQAMNEFNG